MLELPSERNIDWNDSFFLNSDRGNLKYILLKLKSDSYNNTYDFFLLWQITQAALESTYTHPYCVAATLNDPHLITTLRFWLIGVLFIAFIETYLSFVCNLVNLEVDHVIARLKYLAMSGNKIDKPRHEIHAENWIHFYKKKRLSW